MYGVYYRKKREKKAKPSNEKKREKKANLSNIYVKNNNNNKSGIVYIVYVGVAQAWYKGAAMDSELLDLEFSGSY